MKFLVLVILAVIWMSLSACNKKTEKCIYNDVEISCEEFNRRHSAKPSPTPYESEAAMEAEEVTETEGTDKSCLEIAETFFTSEKVNSICEKNEKAGKCIEDSYLAGLNEDSTYRMCIWRN